MCRLTLQPRPHSTGFCLQNIHPTIIVAPFTVLNIPSCQLSQTSGMFCVSEKSSVFVKDPTDLMTNMYGDTLVTTNGTVQNSHTCTDAVG